MNLKVLLPLALCAISSPVYAQNKKQKPVRLAQIFHKSPAQVERLLGKPSSVGQRQSFREYVTPYAGIYTRFTKNRATLVTVTFIKGYASPEKAVAALGINVSKIKPVSQNIIERHWTGVGGARRLSATSTDGQVWETVSISD